MDRSDSAYTRLQKHLNNQAVGFPSTKTGAEIRVLKHIFSPQEAEIASFLSYRFEPLDVIHGRVEHMVSSREDLEAILERIQKKGGAEFKLKEGKKHYCNAPLVVGMYEFQVNRLTPEFIRDFKDYTSDRNFGIELLSTELPQMRTIPIAESIDAQHCVSTFDEVTTLLREAEGPFAAVECICRKKKSMEGMPCQITDRKETCLAMGSMARMALLNGMGSEISRDETISIIELNQKQGLVLQPSNTEKAEFLCSCCGCCCGMLNLHKDLPRPLDFWASNFQAGVDTGTCEGCGACELWCQVGALSLSQKTNHAVVDLNRCLGCGVCVSGCPAGALSLFKKPAEVRPPQTREELYEIIMSRKKGRFGKLKLTGKIVVDALRTGHTRLLKS